MLFIDSREKAQIKALVSSTVTPNHILALSCADFLLYDQDGHSLGVERKTASDLLGSLEKKLANGNKRLYDQVARMAEEYTHRLIVIEGWPSFDRHTLKLITGTRQTGWGNAAIQMIMWGIQAGGTSLLLTSDRWATTDLLRVLHNRAEKGCVLPAALREQIELEQAA